MDPPFTVLLVPSDHLSWAGLRTTLKAWREIRIHDVRRAAEAVPIAAIQPHPTAILVAAELVNPSVVSVVRALHNVSPASKILVIGDPRDQADLEELRRLGTAAYMEWAQLRTEVVQPLLTTVMRSDLLIVSDWVMRRLLDAPERRSRDLSIVLTSDEREVLIGLGTGLTQREIARAVYVSEATVERIIARLRDRCCVSTTCALCAHAGRMGLFDC